ncbi:glycosyltransferase [Niabella yanshanensis]|uniref:Glycosyltransferase n=1 Tax=Niabella yanshanensis TaxID=577386 RepID=A0ABZ0W486_9BACT|nr:glycosyltransferase [Niabella yanshanensis]WQD36896.1 glycosyltransferase [Niabella yanshanensis]
MTVKKRILYFMPDPPTRKDQGNRIHVNQMLEYFQSRSHFMEVDYMAVKEWAAWNEQDTREFKINFPDIGLVLAHKKMSKSNKLKYLLRYKLPNKLRSFKKKYRKNLITDYTTIQIERDFNNQLQRKKYDIVIISYVIWARLIDNNPHLNGAKLINDTHDFMTAQYKSRKNFLLGKTFEKEIELLSLFDEVWSQSADEQYLFSQFVPGNHQFVPILYEDNMTEFSHQFNDSKYDIIYVGSDNENNKKSISWFFEYVYPLLPDAITICVVGLICNHFPSFPNVEKHLFINDLSEYYLRSRISICPMLEGTGVKVKVVEAMSYGLPIVCNLRGLDGLPIKTDNGCLRSDTPEEFSIHIKKLLSNPSYYDSIRTLSRKTFTTYFEKKKVYKQLDHIFDLNTALNGKDHVVEKKALAITA